MFPIPPLAVAFGIAWVVTNSVLAALVVLSPATGVGTVTVPVNVGSSVSIIQASFAVLRFFITPGDDEVSNHCIPATVGLGAVLPELLDTSAALISFILARTVTAGAFSFVKLVV
jgi:hypothetical protein